MRTYAMSLEIPASDILGIVLSLILDGQYGSFVLDLPNVGKIAEPQPTLLVAPLRRVR